MNILLNEALASGPSSSSFHLLLQNYGWWSRCSGCTGYMSHTSDSLPEVIIDDDTAMLVERAVIKLRQSRPNVWRVFYLYYTKGLTQDEIASKIRRENPVSEKRLKRRRGFFSYNPAVSDLIPHLTSETVNDMLALASRHIYENLNMY